MLGLVASCKEREVPFEHSTSAFLNGTTPGERVKTILPFFEYNGIFGLMLDDAQFVSDSFVKEGSEITMDQTYIAVLAQPKSIEVLRKIGEKSRSEVSLDYRFPLSRDPWWIDRHEFRKLTTILPIQLGEQDGWMAIDEQTGWVYFYSETRTN